MVKIYQLKEIGRVDKNNSELYAVYEKLTSHIMTSVESKGIEKDTRQPLIKRKQEWLY